MVERLVANQIMGVRFSLLAQNETTSPFLRCGRFVLSAENRKTDEFVFFASEVFLTKKLKFASRMFSKKTQEVSRKKAQDYILVS